MDGNRRWAVTHGLEKFLGHKEGLKAVERIIDFSLEKGIENLSLYTFSIENLSRSEQEKNYMFDLLINESKARLDDFKKKGVSVKFKGDRLLFPDKVLSSCEMIEAETADQKNLNLNILFCYGGRQEIVSATKKLAEKYKAGQIDLTDFEDQLKKNLWIMEPDPELIIRTGGKNRLSNFLTFQSAYSELMFLDKFWPDLQKSDLEECFEQFLVIQRNFGR